MTEFVPYKTKIPLMCQPYGNEEILEIIDSLLSGKVTMGEKVAKFERMFADYIGVKYAVMVNSGSSANLLALTALSNMHKINPGDEIITPAITWATTVFPIYNIGAIPVLVDVDIDTFNISIEAIRKAITKKTVAIMLVHLLGNPCYMDKINEIAKEYNLYVIEDACESHGAEINRQKTGSFGDISTFSFYYSHHITTIEGGMILTNDFALAELVKSLRAFGWIRELKNKQSIHEQYPELDSRFTFIIPGYCFRPTELQGAMGIHQIKKLDGFVEIRRKNAAFWFETLQKYDKYFLLQQERINTKHVWFSYPITVKEGAPFSCKELVSFLENANVETRPIMTGNMAEQPAMKLINYQILGSLKNSEYVSKNSFFFGNHQNIGLVEREAIVSYIDKFMEKYA
jgi:CDP-4-dehydro-6-deoxyglucose reductase, E1